MRSSSSSTSSIISSWSFILSHLSSVCCCLHCFSRTTGCSSGPTCIGCSMVIRIRLWMSTHRDFRRGAMVLASPGGVGRARGDPLLQFFHVEHYLVFDFVFRSEEHTSELQSHHDL